MKKKIWISFCELLRAYFLKCVVVLAPDRREIERKNEIYTCIKRERERECEQAKEQLYKHMEIYNVIVQSIRVKLQLVPRRCFLLRHHCIGRILSSRICVRVLVSRAGNVFCFYSFYSTLILSRVIWIAVFYQFQYFAQLFSAH